MTESASRRLLDHWQAPEDVGEAVGCLTTTFTYEADFFQKQCLGRFLQLDNQFGESDELSFVIEQEERLCQVPVTVVVDRSYAAEPRNLRWDVLPVGIPGGVQHAKVTILVWEDLVRCLVASANLVEHSYRHNLEVGTVLDAFDGCELPAAPFLDLIKAVRRIVGRAERDVREQGPKQRANALLDSAQRRVRSFDLPAGFGKGAPSVHVVDSGPRKPLLPQLRELVGSAPEEVTVMSPFFDSADELTTNGNGVGQLAAVELGGVMKRRSGTKATFVVPVDRHAERLLVRAPAELRDSFPSRVRVDVCPVEPPTDEDIGRRLHAKVMALHGDRWTIALAGSSNFTSAGLALPGSRGANCEINLAYRVPRSNRRLARELARLTPHGEAIPVEEGEWESMADEEQAEVELPKGFRAFQLDAKARVVELALGSELPREWSVSVFGAETLLNAGAWRHRGRPPRVSAPISPGTRLPFFVDVAWETKDGELRLAWPLNVVDPGALPPPEELRALPLSVLIEALSSTRPIHAALAAALWRRQQVLRRSTKHDPLNPLERYAGTGRFLQRARRFSLALEGLTQRMERPAASEEALEWRLAGPVSPLALARALIADLEEGESIHGEAEFMLAETALSLSRVDWTRTGEIIGGAAAREQAQGLIAKLRELARSVRDSEGSRKRRGDRNARRDALERYVVRAFREARI